MLRTCIMRVYCFKEWKQNGLFPRDRLIFLERPNQNQFNARKYHLTYPCFKFSKFVLTKHLKIVINKLYVPIIKLTRQTMKITCSLSKDSFQKFFFQICWPDYKLILIRIKERRIFAFDDVNLIFTCGCQKSNFPICQ